MLKHSNKHIREAIKYAEDHGWRVVKASGQAHIWGKLYCPASNKAGASSMCIRHREFRNIMRVTFAKKSMIVRIAAQQLWIE